MRSITGIEWPVMEAITSSGTLARSPRVTNARRSPCDAQTGTPAAVQAAAKA